MLTDSFIDSLFTERENLLNDNKTVTGEQVTISKGNSKMGVVPSVSLSAVVTCRNNAPCVKGCYAAKIERLRKTVKDSYHKNTRIAVTDSESYFNQVESFCRLQRYFRWHVSGDIISVDYFSGMVKVARACPYCKFLAFTKQFEIVNEWIQENGELPENLVVIYSNWGEWKCENPFNMPVAEVVFKGSEPLDNWKVCGGNCAECACRGVGCWELKHGETICFNQH